MDQQQTAKTNSYLLPLMMTILYVALLAAGSLTSGRNVPGVAINNFDKFAHTLAYLILAVLLLHLFSSIGKGFLYTFSALIFTIAIGVTLEFSQMFFTQDRLFEVADIVANSTGAILGLILYRLRLPFRTSI